MVKWVFFLFTCVNWIVEYLQLQVSKMVIYVSLVESLVDDGIGDESIEWC